VVFLLVYWLFLKKKAENMIENLKNNTNYFSDYKLLVGGEVLHWFSWYLLLVISLFIFRTAWPGWGDLLVGVNYASYQTISILLFLSLAKESDVRGKRKNLLLSLTVIGTILLFIMAWLSLVPSPGIIMIIIILFTLFVLCFYGLDNLKVVLLTEYFPEKVRGSAFGLMRAIGNIGGLIGGVLSGFLFETIGFWFCFLFGGFVLFASFFIMFKIRDVDVSEEKITINEWFGMFISGVKQIGSKLTNWVKNVYQKMNIITIRDYLFEFQNRRQMTLLFYTTLFTLIAYGMIVPYIMVFLSEARGESATVLSIVYTVFGIAIFLPINQLAAGWLCDKYGARKVYSGAIFAYIGLWGIFNLTIPMTSSNVIIMAVFIFPVWPFLWIGFKLFVSDLTPRTERVRGITAIRLALGIGIVIGSIGGGVLLVFLSYETVFLLAMIFTFIAAGFSMILLKLTGEVEIIEAEVEALPVDG
jgi:predicted MFS family arabinose efflux permease